MFKLNEFSISFAKYFDVFIKDNETTFRLLSLVKDYYLRIRVIIILKII